MNAHKLLSDLGVTHFTDRHIRTINDFVESDEKQATVLLDKLGSWDDKDLEITEKWISEKGI